MSSSTSVSSRRQFLRHTRDLSVAGVHGVGVFRAGFFRAGVSVVGVGGLSARRVRAAPSATLIETRVISKTPDLYCGWPTLTRRSNGELLLVYSGGRERHVCPFGRVDMMRSGDNGASWSWPRTLLDGPIDDRDAGVVETSQGSLLVTTFTSLAYEDRLRDELAKRDQQAPRAWSEEQIGRWQAVQRRLSPAARQAELGQWMIRSIDGGVSWSARYRVPVDSPHGPIQLADGRLLYAGKKLWTKGKESTVYQSSDDGQNWSWLATVPTRDGDQQRNYHELHVVETNAGKLVMHIRNHNEANHRETLQCESTDGGSTWSTPHPIGVWGLPSHLLKLADGRLLMTYGYRRPPFGNQARVSSDGGDTWSEPITLSSDGPGSDLGYPSTVQLEDSSLVTVWYEKMAGSHQAVLRQARWRLES